MKFLIFFTIWASAVACIFACNPDGSNEPICDKTNVDKPIRNFWNPNVYWLCKEDRGKAESVTCPDARGFDEETGQCVPFSKLKWKRPCSKATAEPVTEPDADDGTDAVEHSDETNESDSTESVNDNNTMDFECD